MIDKNALQILLCVLVAAVCFWWVARGVYRARNWCLVKGAIASAYINGDDGVGEGNTMWSPKVEYDYAFRGQKYVGAYSPGGDWETASALFARFTIRSYVVGESIDVYVNPKYPSNSTLVVGVRWIPLLVGSAMCAVALYVLFRR